MNDLELDSLIRSAHPKPELPVTFNREVWERISVTGPDSLAEWCREFTLTFFQWIAKPAPAAAVFAVLLTVGAGLGGLSLKEDITSAQRTAYLASINPLHPIHLAEQE